MKTHSSKEKNCGNEDLDKKVDKVEKCKDAAEIIKGFEEIIKNKEKNI